MKIKRKDVNESPITLRHTGSPMDRLRQSKAVRPPSGSLTLIENLRILCPDFGYESQVDKNKYLDGSIEIEAGLIKNIHECGTPGEAHARSRATVIDGSGYIALPGFINIHTHAAMGFFRGLGHGKTNMIENFLFPAEKALTPELLEPLSWSYLVSCLRAGITTIGEHYYMVDGVGAALERIGMRGFIGETIADLGGAFPGRERWAKARSTIESWQRGPLIKPVVAPHAADTVSTELLTEMANYSVQNDLPLHMHLSQTNGEMTRVTKNDNMTPVEKAARCGALHNKTIAVHLVSAKARDFELLRNSKATAVLCPSSQLIYEQLAPLDFFADQGQNWALATDCAASNDGADLLTECKLAALFANDRKINTKNFDPAALIDSITANPARALGMGGKLGLLAPGAFADITFMRDDLSLKPAFDDLRNLIFSGHQGLIEHVMIDGKWILWSRDLCTVDEQQLEDEFNQAITEITRRAGLQ